MKSACHEVLAPFQLNSSPCAWKSRRNLDEVISASCHNVTNSEAIMTTRKPKPTISPLFELPIEQLQLATVTVEHKVPARAGQIWRAETELPVDRSLTNR